MGERYLERIVASGIKIGTIQTLKALGLLPEVVTISQAEKDIRTSSHYRMA